MNLSFCDDTFTNAPQVFPGRSFEVSLAAHGQSGGFVLTIIESEVPEPAIARISEASAIQQINIGSCNNLRYTVFLNAVQQLTSNSKLSQRMHLQTEGLTCAISLVLPFKVTILPCPSGFELSNTSGECVCEERLRRYIPSGSCNIEDMTIERNDDFWVGFDTESNGLNSPSTLSL